MGLIILRRIPDARNRQGYSSYRIIKLLPTQGKDYITRVPVWKFGKCTLSALVFPNCPLHKTTTEQVLSKDFLIGNLIKIIQICPLVLNPKQNPRCTTSLQRGLKISAVPVLSISPHCNVVLISLAAEDPRESTACSFLNGPGNEPSPLTAKTSRGF